MSTSSCWKNIFFSLIITILFFLGLEFTIRIYHAIKFKDRAYLFYGSDFVRELVKEKERKQFDEIYKPYELRLEADNFFLKRKTTPRHGWPLYFRSQNVTAEKTPGIIRIVFMGGSFVYGAGLDDTETFSYLLCQKLNKYSTSKKYEEINCSKGGADINMLLKWLMVNVAPLKPEYLMLFSAYNNFYLLKLNREFPFSWKMSHFLYNVSRFYATIRDKLAVMLSKDLYFFHENWGVVITKEEAEESLELYRNRLRQILTVCRENNIKLILCLQPMFLPENLKELADPLDEKELTKLSKKIEKEGRLSNYEFKYYMQGNFNFEMKRFAESEGVLLFDGASIFPKDKYLYFSDVIHLNHKGAAILADELFSFCVENGIAEKQMDFLRK